MRLASRKKPFHDVSGRGTNNWNSPVSSLTGEALCLFLVRSILTPPTCPGTVDGSRGNLHKPASLASTVAVSAATWLLSSWRRRMIGTLE